MSKESVNEYLWNYGYPWAPGVREVRDLTQGLLGPHEPCPDEMRNLDEDDPARKRMVKILQQMMPAYGALGVEVLGRAPMLDGVAGPVTENLIELPRCGCPDFPMPVAIGSGPWKGCHGVGDFHSASVHFTNSPPAHLLQDYPGGNVFQEVLRRVRKGYAEIGLLFHFSGVGTGVSSPKTPVQSNASFVGSSAGWIGLAIIGNNSMTCTSSPIWCRYLSSFDRNQSVKTIIHSWTLLIMHELGHNCGLGHTSGGIMNPSINRGAKESWIGDTAESWMKNRFGGEPVGDGPGPKPDPEPDSILKRILDFLKRLFGGK